MRLHSSWKECLSWFILSRQFSQPLLPGSRVDTHDVELGATLNTFLQMGQCGEHYLQVSAVLTRHRALLTWGTLTLLA